MPKSLKASLLAATFVALAPLAAQAQQAQQPTLPEGEGKLLADGICVTCHRHNMITNSMGYTQEGWKELIGTMIDMSANTDMRDKLTAYLAQHFPPNTRRAPKLVSGPVADHLEGMGEPAARAALARSDGRSRRAHLVGRPVRQCDGPSRPKDRRDEGIHTASQCLPAHRRARCQGQRLVHGQQERHGRLHRSQERADQGLQDARPEREGPAHAGVRQARASPGSRCRTATWWGVSIRRAATSSSSR